ncbi:MAG TPA: type II toxin-antitoxin system VapC family toxin [Blastocatellia bacterium]|nr:type II toxin-antitoxin system VapC family toxin [Blastocatellia bacterium]
MIREILLDTNAYSAFKRNAQDAVEIIRHVPLIGINSIVFGELLSGFSVGSREETNRQELKLFLASQRVKLFPVDDITADYYAMIYRNLRQKGQPIPTNDMWIAATALQHSLTVFTYDGHFQSIDGLITGNRLSDFMI